MVEQYFGYQVPSLGTHKSRYRTKQQKPPRRIKFLQERLDHSWDVHAIGQAFGLVCNPGVQRRSLTNAVVFTERRRSE